MRLLLNLHESVPPQDPLPNLPQLPVATYRPELESRSLASVDPEVSKLNVSHSSSAMDIEEQPYLPFGAKISLVKDILRDQVPVPVGKATEPTVRSLLSRHEPHGDCH